MRRTIDWHGDAVTIIDQTALPAEYRVLMLRTVDELIDAIRLSGTSRRRRRLPSLGHARCTQPEAVSRPVSATWAASGRLRSPAPCPANR
ncbi:hypothetical protein BRW65_29160 [Mycobacterium paraffinicum]|uniref:Uncharacterized protein n=1 Tax=Mycobacterium paraffinicum TaxID=53378 RepID=A0A1Q4H9V9_9MYCO|nr:hypothetical protein BRW65_29160 [Mycobacterium paraffinicum]